MDHQQDGNMLALLLWLCWSGPIALSGLFIFLFHFVENASLITVGAAGSLLSILAYFIGKKHRTEDKFDEEDLLPGEKYCVLWKSKGVFSCEVVLRDRAGQLLPFVLPQKLFDDLAIDQEFEVQQFSPYFHDENIPEDAHVPKTYVTYTPGGAPSRVG